MEKRRMKDGMGDMDGYTEIISSDDDALAKLDSDDGRAGHDGRLSMLHRTGRGLEVGSVVGTVDVVAGLEGEVLAAVPRRDYVWGGKLTRPHA